MSLVLAMTVPRSLPHTPSHPVPTGLDLHALLPPHLHGGLLCVIPPQSQAPQLSSSLCHQRRPQTHSHQNNVPLTLLLCYPQNLKASSSRPCCSRMEFPFVSMEAQLSAFSLQESLGPHRPIWISIFSSTKNWQKL